ncbi:MAG: RnfABCDGE type electron transport complex subunit D [Pseudomonadota bacterium]
MNPAASAMSRMMLYVVLATVPFSAYKTSVYGIGVLVHLLLCVAACMVTEFVCMRLRYRAGRPIDTSAILTGTLIACCVPALAPWYVSVFASVAAVGLAKHAFGGAGSNVFNPAMTGYALLLILFPEAMTRWPAESVTSFDSIRAIFGATAAGRWDTLTGATSLVELRSGLGQMKMLGEILTTGDNAARGLGTWGTASIVAGGLFLLRMNVIRWQLPVSTLLGAAFCAGVLSAIDPDRFASATFHLSTGGILFAAFFIVTDPVTAARRGKARLVYGSGIGVLAILMRTLSAYPDGVAFAVLLMNALVPLLNELDRPTKPPSAARADVA